MIKASPNGRNLLGVCLTHVRAEIVADLHAQLRARGHTLPALPTLRDVSGS
jgi:hypothetical protein